MFTQFGKRSISFLLALAMMLSMVPVQAFAAEDIHDHTEGDHAELLAMTVTALPEKTEYVQGEELDVAGGMIALEYSDGHIHEEAMTDEMVFGYDPETVGEQTVEVWYEEFVDTFTVTVAAAAAPVVENDPTETEAPAADETDPTETDPTETEAPEVDETEPTGTEGHVHSYQGVVTDPKCMVAGFTTYTCDCGDEYIDDVTPATGHSYVSEDVEEGVKYTCSVCGDYYVDEKPAETQPSGTEEGENPYIAEIQATIDEMLTWYLGGTQKTREEIEYIVENDLTVDDIWMAKVEFVDLEATMQEYLTEEECVSISENNTVARDFHDVLSKYASGANLLKTGEFTVANGNINMAFSGSSDADTGTKKSEADATFAAWASGGKRGSTNTITVTNNTDKKAIISFSYTISGDCSGLTIAGASKSTSGSGSYTSAELAGGASITMAVTGKGGWLSGEEPQFVLTGITWTEVVENPKITLVADSAYGGIIVNGTAVTSGTVQEVTTGGSINLGITKNSDTIFLGWIDGEGKILSKEESFTLSPKADMMVTPAFTRDGGTPWFGVGGAAGKQYQEVLLFVPTITVDYYVATPNYLFDDLNEAAAASGSAIVLMNNGTLPAGNYSIPAGKTLLVPFDSNNTMYTTAAMFEDIETYTTPTAYRTLTMSSGAHLEINGGLSLSANHTFGNGSRANGGSPTGPVSFLQMEEGSSVTINNGGGLYAYGYITGSGEVTVKNGGKVYELFQIMDFRGGTQSTKMENGVFPLSQYYIQNVEVHMTLEYGAKEYSYTTIQMSSQRFASSVNFIGPSGCMFNLTSGSVTKDYDENTDRLVVEADGNLTVSPIDLQIGTSSINSKDYDLGINGNITVTVRGGNTITMNQDIALLPGTQLIIDEGAYCVLNTGINVFVYDADEWGDYTFGNASVNTKFKPVTYAPGRRYNRTEADIVDATILVNGHVDASKGYVYTTPGGANVYSTGSGEVKLVPGTQTIAYQLVQGGTDSTGAAVTTHYAEIPLATAALTNADGSHIATQQGTYEYDSTNGVWHMTQKVENGATVDFCDMAVKEQIVEPKSCNPNDAGKKWYGCTCEAVSSNAEVLTMEHDPGPEATCKNAQTCQNSLCAMVLVAKLPHTMTAIAAVEPQCETAGNNAYYSCSSCNGYYKDAEGNTITDPQAEVLPALDHNKDTILPAVAATCTTDGKTEGRNCSRCGEVQVPQTTVNKLGHQNTPVAAVAPTCEKTGLTEGKKCDRCGEFSVPQTEVAALGHKYTSAVTKAATCYEEGVTTFTCQNDNSHTYTEPIEKTSHAMGDVNAKAATCEAIGWSAYRKCYAEGCTYTEGYVEIPALGHKYDEGAVTTKPTCTTEGVTTYTCQNDKSHTSTEAIAALGHLNDVDLEGYDADCLNEGKTAGKYCSQCKTTTVPQEVIPAKGHTEEILPAEEATCTAAGKTAGKKCSVCQATIEAQKVVPATGHSYNEGEITTDPTCYAEGVKTFTCVHGDDSYTEKVAKIAHTIVQVEAKAPTCTEVGWNAYEYCSVAACGYTTYSEIEAKGHNLVEVEAKDATCTEAGYNDHKKCLVCGEKEDFVEKAALGHEYTTVVTAPTCEAQGYTTYTCKRDDHTYVADQVPALNHDYVGAVTTEPTCTAAGVKTYTCQNDSSHTYTEVLIAKGHTPIAVEAKAPTCTEAGYEAYTYCSECDFTTFKEVAATGHSYNEGEITTDPTCYAEGVKTFTCVHGDDSYTEKVAKIAHTIVQVEAKAPTCTEVGWNAYEYCSVAACDYTTYSEIKANGHNMADVHGKDAKCEEAGYSDHKKCVNCDYKEGYEVLPALEHDYKAVVTAPTCEAQGYTTYTCSRDAKHTYTSDYTDALEHDYVGTVTTEPTCTKTGVMTYTCKNDSSHTYTEDVAAKGHTLTQVEAKAPTCTDAGYEAYEYCSVCDYTTFKAVAATGHSYDSVVTAPSCEAKGYTTHTCHCGDTYTDSETAAIGHKYTAQVTKTATCTEAGERVYTCSNDAEHTYKEVIPAKGHTRVQVAAKEETCTEIGWDAYEYCSVTGCGYTTYVEIPATGHSYESVVTDPGCEAQGYTTHTCHCGDTYKDSYTNATGHTEEILPAKDPTCTETGLEAGKKCSVCQKITEPQAVINATGHEYDAVVTAPTCTEAGYTTYTCHCGDSYVADEVAALGHDYSAAVTAPTCTEAGYTTYTCHCGDSYVADEVAALGHSYDAVVTEPKCTEAGYTTYTCHCGDTYVADEVEAAGHTPGKEANCTEDQLCTVCEAVLVEKLGHTLSAHEAKAPTCTEIGWKAFETCSRCDYTTYEEIAPLQHNYVGVVTNPATCLAEGEMTYTCTNDASHTYTAPVAALGHELNHKDVIPATCTKTGTSAHAECIRCDYTENEAVLPALGHDWKETAREEATCTTDGYISYVCNREDCDEPGATKTDVLEALGHTLTAVEAKAPTCTEAGYEAYEYCSECDYTTFKEVAATGHGYEAAVTAPTCTAAGYTTYTCHCGDSYVADEVAALGHAYSAAVTAPTCTEAGYTTYTCRCGDSYVADEVAARGHKYSAVVTAPYCETVGYTTYTCNCGDSYVADEVAALGHDEVIDAAVKATCLDGGKTEGKHCDRCGTVLKKQIDTNPLGHDEVIDEAVAATCTASGKTEGKHCYRCPAIIEAQQVVGALGHDPIYHEAKEATCTADGHEAYETCSRCPYTTYKKVDMLGHDIVKHDAQEPTCDAIGWEAYESCGRCDYTTYQEEAALGHNITTHEAKAPTCTAIGWDAYVTCSRCSLNTYAEKPALGHDKIAHDAQAVTCTEIGWDAYVTCSRCKYTTCVEIPATGHSKHYVGAQAATCTEIGWDAYEYCSVCDYTTYEEIPATGHSLTAVEAKVPTCTEIGWDAYEYCSECDYTTYEEIPENGHNLTAVEAKAPTCTENGWDAYEYCENCDYTTCVEKAKLGHDYQSHDGQAPTCTEDGWKQYVTCSFGDYSTYEAIPATGHNLTNVEAKAETCTEIGWNAYEYCSKCEYTTYEEIPATGHSKVTVDAQAATCTEIGWNAYEYCSVCDYTTYEEIPATGHSKVTVPAKAPTCTAIGWNVYEYCSACDYTTYVEIPAAGHTLTNVEAQAVTCTEIGWDAYEYCTKCSYSTYEEIPATGHDLSYETAKAASCTEIGWDAYEHCANCDYSTYKEIAELGHEYVGVNGQAATCTVAGWTPYVICARCNYNTYEEIPATGHNLTEVEAKAATCTAVGWEAYVDCSKCDYSTYVEIPATGHSKVTVEAKEATCTEIGWNEYEYCSVDGCGYTTYVEILAKGHSEAAHPAKAATCTEIGWGAYVSCGNCDYTTYVEIPATGHNLMKVEAKAATCETIGWDAYEYCTKCTYTTYAEIPVQEHTYVSVVTAPTCLDKGYTTHICSSCGNSYVDAETDALGHDMAPATCTAPMTCKNGCGLTEGTALGHTVVVDEDMMALCEDDGLTEGSHCSVCGVVLVPQEVIPALGHAITEYEAKQATYTGVGWEAYEACSRCAYSTKVEIPALGERTISDYETFLENLEKLEEMAAAYVRANPGKDAAALVIKYIRTGVDRYNSGSWGIMAGYEDAGFAAYVAQTEDAYNAPIEDQSQWMMVSALKNIKNFELPNGDVADLGHVFGMMDITYHNNFGLNHMDIGGWLGDTVDLLSLADQFGVSGTLDEMVKDLTDNYLLQPDSTFPEKPIEGSFSLTDMQGDLDGYFIMHNLQSMEYGKGVLTALLSDYFTEDLTDVDRAAYLLKNRLNGVTLREQVRNAVYNAYTGNKMVKTLEDTREFTSADLATLKKACCYAVADYLCRLAGDFVDVTDNSYFEVFSSERSNLAPGITQDIKYATSADGKQMVFYIATADLTREDIDLYANYTNNDPTKWAMSRVLDQANFAQQKYGNPESEHYIENYNVIASINGAGYNMGTGEPGGLLVMGGVEYHAINSNGFFGITMDGEPVIGTTEEYNTIYKGKLRDGIAAFGSTLVKDGKVCINRTENYYTDRASRTAIGITKTGKVVFMVLDGRQEPFSCGGSMQEIAQIMLEAGCVTAVNLDGGGSTTYVAKPEGEDALKVVNKPSDGSARSVSTSLIMVSTAPSSTAFDHAIVKSETNYMTVGSSQQIEAEGVSATGNAAEIPEGTFWAVSDESYGTITEDGTFTALKNGTVEIYLMVGTTVLGSKAMNIVLPDNVYFTKSKVDVVYGETVELPVKALYDGKPVTILPSDLVFTLELEAAGTVDGFSFTAAETATVKRTKLTVALAHDDTITASLTVALFNQGEATFDFDKATAGDRQFAWDRQVSNSTTEDNVTYSIIEEGKDMVTSYIFAIDMTQIPIPPQLGDLIYMLPGADLENASAWNFLLQLAQRVSVLTEVRPVVHIDPNFDVDYSEVTLVNEYFELKETQMDEETNTLTLVLKWKKQTQAIDPNEANPMCILSGIKVTPKADAEWDEKDVLNVVHSGEVGYDIYLRASSLYTFAQKPENQATYGLYPFVNPNDSSEAGAHMSSVYTSFSDSYTLVKALKNGWIIEDGGFAYYVDGVKHTGIKQVEGLYYDFGENGLNVGQTPYTGLFVGEDGKTYYAKVGSITTGWNQINGVWHMFDEKTGAGYHGTYRNFFNGVTYVFENGRLTEGVWLKDSKGYQYYYGPGRYQVGWKVIDGKSYYFQDFHRLEGLQPIKESNDNRYQWFIFDENGVLTGYAPDGLLEYNGKLYYVLEGYSQLGLQYIDGYYYYFKSDGTAVTGNYYVTTHNDLKPSGYYDFDEDYRMIIKNGFVHENDGIYYYVDGALTYAGLILYEDGYYYYVNGKCQAVTGNYYVTKHNDLMEPGYYNFDENGRMLTKEGFVQENGGIYYYYQGVLTPAGLIYVGGQYYYVDGTCKVVTGRYYVTKHNGLLPVGYYEFDERGRMIISDKDGFVEEEDGIYYYVGGQKTYAGLLYVNDYYYYVNGKGKVVTGNYYVSKTNGLLASDYYNFDEQGRMIIPDGFFEESDGVYYYQGGKRFYAGLIYLDGYYYYVNGRCLRVTGNYYVTENNDLLPSAYYDFDEQGRMVNYGRNGFVEEADGIYYYVNGSKTYAGLIFQDGNYYYVNGKGKVVTGTYYVSKNNGLLASNYYDFDAQGRMIRTAKEGFVEENGVTYYYVSGLKNYAGLISVDGNYYYVNGRCQVVTGAYFVTKNNDLMPAGYYNFAEDGRMIID